MLDFWKWEEKSLIIWKTFGLILIAEKLTDSKLGLCLSLLISEKFEYIYTF